MTVKKEVNPVPRKCRGGKSCIKGLGGRKEKDRRYGQQVWDPGKSSVGCKLLLPPHSHPLLDKLCLSSFPSYMHRGSLKTTKALLQLHGDQTEEQVKVKK